MTAEEIAARLVTQPVTPLRVQKMVQLCARMRVPVEDVLVQLPPDTQTEVRALL